MSKRAFLTLGIGFGLVALAAQHAMAQENPNCAPRQQVLEQLRDRYGEIRQSIGLSAEETVVEMFASHLSGTWTITVTLPNGMTCLVASGQAFENMAADALPPGNDA